jgi:NAD(P)-dependent dehydrogenase (short-subunit alcohol dehydrogenase family)
MTTTGLWFQGKSVLVTGAGSGIGRATAKRFGAEGAGVCVADVDGEAARRVVAEITGQGGQAFACQADIALEVDNDRMVADVVQRFGGLDVAFLNAGYGGWAIDAFEGDVADFDRIIAINLRGCYLGLRSVARAIRSGGAIVVTASVGGVTGVSFNPAYAASKHGVIGLVRSMAEAFAAKGVRINALCPGGVNTPMVGAQVADLGLDADALPMVGFRKRAFPEHMAETVLFMASNRAGGMTGSSMVVDAGQTSALVRPLQ